MGFWYDHGILDSQKCVYWMRYWVMTFIQPPRLFPFGKAFGGEPWVIRISLMYTIRQNGLGRREARGWSGKRKTLKRVMVEGRVIVMVVLVVEVK